MPKPTKAELKDKAAAAIHKASADLARAEATVKRRREQLEDAVAAGVTTRPDLETWPEHPGVLLTEEAASFAGTTTLGLYKLLTRQRTRAKEQRRKSLAQAQRKQRASARPRARAARTAREALAPRF